MIVVVVVFEVEDRIELFGDRDFKRLEDVVAQQRAVGAKTVRRRVEPDYVGRYWNPHVESVPLRIDAARYRRAVRRAVAIDPLGSKGSGREPIEAVGCAPDPRNEAVFVAQVGGKLKGRPERELRKDVFLAIEVGRRNGAGKGLEVDKDFATVILAPSQALAAHFPQRNLGGCRCGRKRKRDEN